MQIFVRGDIGSGKSTLIRRVTDDLAATCGVKAGGLRTGAVAPDDSSIYIGAYGEPLTADPARLIGRRADLRPESCPAIFDKAGCEILEREQARSDLLCLDELGFFENAAERFQRLVLDILDSGRPVLGALKTRDVPWYRTILNRPTVNVFELTEQNRDALFRNVLALLQQALRR